jgi:hypothetical protein
VSAGFSAIGDCPNWIAMTVKAAVNPKMSSFFMEYTPFHLFDYIVSIYPLRAQSQSAQSFALFPVQGAQKQAGAGTIPPLRTDNFVLMMQFQIMGGW